MKKLLLIAILPTSLLLESKAQVARDSAYLVALNQRIDSLVVIRNVTALDSLYAVDFVFSHGSGRVEGKSGWLTTVGRANYPLRQHDSVKVELHPGLAVVKGKMSIQKINKDKTDRYHLRYIRVYALRGRQWQLVSHNTTTEYHEP
ncbi:MAG: nuclear transport factor 2 family protein [Chitinophagaceae bacterium]|nr:nuclear transport factor 2 family protein [Chitinophagaceae bacterium]